MKYFHPIIFIIFVTLIGIGVLLYQKGFLHFPSSVSHPKQIVQTAKESEIESYPLSIVAMRKREYTGSDITIEQTLSDKNNYHQYIVSYQSDGLKIRALMTVPTGDKPKNGWPVIIFNHGYIPPEQYRTTERYVAYVDAFARNGYIVLKSDYRGHDESEGKPEGGYYSPGYTDDVLNGLASMKKYPQVDPNRIGMWGHSMGGSLTLRSLVISKDIKAAVIWAGVVADYYDLATNWHRAQPFTPSQREQAARQSTGRQSLTAQFGDFNQNPEFWKAIAPINFVSDITAPVQIQHAKGDEEVPILFSEKLNDALKNAGKTVEFYSYEGDDHNISEHLGIALDRSVAFFDKYVK